MKKAVLLNRVNAIAHKRFGVRVTGRMLSDFVNEDMVQKSTALGRAKGSLKQRWEWSEEHFQRLLYICELMGHGNTRKSGIRIELWLDGNPINTSRLKEDFEAEFKRLRKKRMKPITVGFDPEQNRHMSLRQRQKLERQIGNLAPELGMVGVAAPVDGMIKMLQVVGSENSGVDISSYISCAMDVVGGNQNEMPQPPNLDVLIGAAMSGLYGDPDYVENNAETYIAKIDVETFESARTLLNLCLWTLENSKRLISCNASESMGQNEAREKAFAFILNRFKRGSCRLEFFISLLMLIQRAPSIVMAIQYPLQNAFQKSILASQQVVS